MTNAHATLVTAIIPIKAQRQTCYFKLDLNPSNDDKKKHLCPPPSPLTSPKPWPITISRGDKRRTSRLRLNPTTEPARPEQGFMRESGSLAQLPGSCLATWGSCLACAPFVYLWHEEATANIYFARVGLVMPVNSLWFGLKADKAEGTPFGCAQSRPWAPKSY